jgi:hypothetical protein
MKELVFLLEESSAQEMLKGLLPRVLPEGIGYRCIPFQGKQDLEKQLVRKIRGYNNPEALFIVMRDLDSHPDCRALKAQLLEKCRESGKVGVTLVRLACKELESFYLADLAAVEAGLGINGLQRHQQNRKFRAPDNLGSPKRELLQLTKNIYQEGAGSRAIGRHLDPDNTRSDSFRNLVAGIRRQCEALAAH